MAADVCERTIRTLVMCGGSDTVWRCDEWVMVSSARLWNVRSHEDLLGQWGALPKYYKTRM